MYHQGYNKEDCTSDEGWCFKDAVGKALPSTFFSYTVQKSGSTVLTPAISSAVLDIHVPNQATILNRAAQDSVLEVWGPEIPAHTEPVSDPSKQSLGSRLITRKEHGHRFLAVHFRRQTPLPTPLTQRSALSVSQEAVVKGYSDGFNTAKIFASNGLSKLGFEGQYIEDSLRSLGNIIDVGEQDVYREWLRKGLADGEALVKRIVLVA